MRLLLNSDCLPATMRVIFAAENEAVFFHFDDAGAAVFRVFARLGGRHGQHADAVVFVPSDADAGYGFEATHCACRQACEGASRPLQWHGDGGNSAIEW